MKKIVSLLISMLILISYIPSVWAASDSDNSQKREILDALGIMSIENNSEFVTRREFFDGLLYMVCDSYDKGAVKEILTERGIIAEGSDVIYAGDNYITYNDAITSVVTILGYDQIARWDGDYTEGYIKIAQNIGILKGVAGKRTLSIDRESLVNLLYNAIKAEPATMSFSGGDISYGTARGETILSLSRKIYEISGIVEANQFTSLIGENGNSCEQITIAGENYYINGTNAGSLLGYYVKGYIQKWDNDDGKVIFFGIEDGRNSELVIESKDILSVSPDCSKIEYQRNESGGSRRANISSTVRVIYNGKFYDKYTSNDFIVQNGNLRLVDNNSDSEYDCVFITDYQTMIVEYTSSYSYEIYGKYKYSGAFNYLKLESPDENKNIHYYLADEEVTFDEIGKDDILTVQISKGNSNIYANIYISRNIISGNVSMFDPEEETIKIDGTEYRVLNSCLNEISLSGGLDLSGEYLFYIDRFNNLAYIKRTQTTDYCLFYRVKEDRKSGEYKVEYLNDNSEWVKASLARKVKYNGSSEKAEAVFGYLNGLEPQVMVIKCNQEGEIKTVMMANATSNFTKTSELSRQYRSTPRSFDCDLYLESDARVFVFPQTSAEDKEGYFVTTSSYLAGDKNYSMTAYDVDEYNFAKAISVKDNAETKSAKMKGWLIVNKIIKRLNDDDEVVSVVSGAMGSYFNVEFEGVDDNVFNGVTKGSIIKVGLNKDNKADSWKKIQDSVSSSGDIWQDPVVIDGTVVSCDANGGKLKLIKGTTYTHLRCSSSTNVLIYTTDDNSIRAASIAELIPGDNLYINISWAIPQTIMVIR